ncbi:glycosyltransferase [Mycobacterium spongiae]|uniref:Glycosyltransferase n=1 Tax=Mycobacterium spongiae TaxID=886343 RepID=A0A975JZ85_9MYCO|nr:glycosyltransferase [Mycobacterium spongiae]QUR67328.1 glycosyltransferase [Mycobacterium spongiae]
MSLESLPRWRKAGPGLPESAPRATPKVSVVSITYNHQAYIRESLDGFVSQMTDFPVEIIVADDASTDATPAIIQEYSDRYPHLFRPILRPKNVGVHANLTDALSAAQGDYLALCEGDDFWIDPLKLSKQIAFLDQHPQTTVCFHPVRVTWDDGRAQDSEFPPNFLRRDLSVEALIARNFIQTNSVVYRRQPCYDDIPAGIMPVDWYLHLRHAVSGDIAMLTDTMAVYRRHEQGIWHSSYADPPKFWRELGPGLVATLDAMLSLVAGNSVREEIIGEAAYCALTEIAKVPGAEGRGALAECLARHPGVASLALRHRWRQTPWRRLKSRLSAEVWGWRAHADLYAGRVKHEARRARQCLTAHSLSS